MLVVPFLDGFTLTKQSTPRMDRKREPNHMDPGHGSRGMPGWDCSGQRASGLHGGLAAGPPPSVSAVPPGADLGAVPASAALSLALALARWDWQQEAFFFGGGGGGTSRPPRIPRISHSGTTASSGNRITPMTEILWSGRQSSEQCRKSARRC